VIRRTLRTLEALTAPRALPVYLKTRQRLQANVPYPATDAIGGTLELRAVALASFLDPHTRVLVARVVDGKETLSWIPAVYKPCNQTVTVELPL